MKESTPTTTEIQETEEVLTEEVVDKKKAWKAAAAKIGIQLGISVAVGLVSHAIVKAIENSLSSSEEEDGEEILEEETTQE